VQLQATLVPGQEGAIVPSGQPQDGQRGHENVRRRPLQAGQEAGAARMGSRRSLEETAPRMVLQALCGSNADMTSPPSDGSRRPQIRVTATD
jgi:hypothetical protein